MKSFCVNLVVAACALHEGSAFSTLPPPRPSSLAAGSSTHQTSSLHAASLGSSSPRGNNDPVSAGANLSQTLTGHELREMETIRGELVQKYIALGHSEEYAAREVNYFLEDSGRSREFVEMRRVAMARGNDLGIETTVQFAAAFFVGWLGSWGIHSLQAFQAANPDGGLPWIS